MAKKIPLTREAAGELEELIGDYCAPDPNGFGNPKRDITDLLRQAGAPKDVITGIVSRMDGIVEDVKCLEEELTRGNAEAVVDGCKRLDEYLAKHFTVPMPRKREYVWAVWS